MKLSLFLSALALSVLSATLCEARSLQYTTHYGQPAETMCKSKNVQLADFLRNTPASSLLPRSSNFEQFLVDLKEQLDTHMVSDRIFHHLFSEKASFYPYCEGDWMEFGVAYAATINMAAEWRERTCGHCPFVHGFDTFTGLPEYWKRDDHSDYQAGVFDLEGKFPAVHHNVHLVKGLFNESLPAFLKKQAAYGAADSPMSFLHIDCDLYQGAADAFSLLSHKIVPGTIIVFDDLVNYQYFREGEMKAWWEYLQASGAKFATIGMLGPLPGKNYAVELHMPDGAHDWFYQSAAFVVVSIPGKTNPFEREARGGARSLSGELHHRKDSVVKASKEDPHIEDNLE